MGIGKGFCTMRIPAMSKCVAVKSIRFNCLLYENRLSVCVADLEQYWLANFLQMTLANKKLQVI